MRIFRRYCGTALVMFTALNTLPALAYTIDEAETEVEASVSIELVRKTRVSERTYDVTAEGDHFDSRSEVFDEALYKAARKTLNKDYEWFRVLDRDTDRETVYTNRDRGSTFEARYERVPVRRCGLLACSTTYESRKSGHVEYRTPERAETRYSVTLEFEMGDGPAPEGPSVYDASLIKRSYR